VWAPDPSTKCRRPPTLAEYVSLVMRRGTSTALVPAGQLPVLTATELNSLLAVGATMGNETEVTKASLAHDLWGKNNAILGLEPLQHARIIVLGRLATWYAVTVPTKLATAWADAVRGVQVAPPAGEPATSAAASSTTTRRRKRDVAVKRPAGGYDERINDRVREDSITRLIDVVHDSLQASEDDDGTMVTPWLASDSGSEAARAALAAGVEAGIIFAEDHPAIVVEIVSGGSPHVTPVLLHPGQCLPAPDGDDLAPTPDEEASGKGAIDANTTLLRRFFPRDMPVAAGEFAAAVTAPDAEFAFCLRLHRRHVFAPERASASGGILPGGDAPHRMCRPVLRLEAVYPMSGDAAGVGYPDE